MEHTRRFERKRDILSPAEWRSTHVGMWAWLLQRFSALALIVFFTLHFCYPYQIAVQILLLSTAAVHAVLGLRVILLDLGTRVALQRLLFGGFMALGVVVIVIVAKWRIFY